MNTLAPSKTGGTLLDTFSFDGAGQGWRGHLAERLRQGLATLA
jgi:hypothetical protein